MPFLLFALPLASMTSPGYAADPELMDACQTELTNLENEDEANGTGCSSPEDTAAG